ncbi:hypothetical protein OG897_36310 [Streptomyces sp. NBC_00237]|uniref:hypothetical protein n=1 Tax=Streptomyces sp. NBC_00237 TaxID=2975687 RepID=UPI00225A2760|nr:hypothetical protein [Streptomyces sp. NBC_00237]MCX5206851.1 hypothetical protein [Streptomyces sp. NBC_00237]
MRAIIGRAVAASALAVIAIAPLAGTAAASTVDQTAKSTVAADRCWRHHGHLYCDDGPWGPWGHHHGVGVGVGVGLGLGVLL